VASGHLVTHLEFPFLGNIHLGKLNNTSRKFIPNGNVVTFAFVHSIKFLEAQSEVTQQFSHLIVPNLIGRPFVGIDILIFNLMKQLGRELGSLGDQFLVVEILHTLRGLSAHQSHQFVHQTGFEFSNLLIELCLEFQENILLVSFGFLVLHHPGEQFFIHNNPVQRGGCLERGILNIAGFVSKNSAKQFFLRGRIGFTLRCDLSNQNITRLHMGTDTNQTVFIQVAGSFLADVGNIRGQLFQSTLGIAHF